MESRVIHKQKNREAPRTKVHRVDWREWQQQGGTKMPPGRA